jgi:hypothetical protein
MSKHNRCPICNGTAKTVRRAFISPWVRNLGGIHQRRSQYCLCSKCESGFFDYRYSAAEMEGIYSDYRGARYLRARQEWEPSYTHDLNDSLGNCQKVLDTRHQLVLSALATFPKNTIQNVVDVGGDQGQFIPPCFQQRFVLDVSGKQLATGIKRVTNLSEARNAQPDLVMACGILEHVADPQNFMADLVEITSNRSGVFIYIEVPSGVPKSRSLRSRTTEVFLGEIASRSRRLWAYLDSVSASARKGQKQSSISFPMRQSEHINFFSRDGLRFLADNSGAEIRLLDEVRLPTELLSGGRLQFSSSLRMLLET